MKAGRIADDGMLDPGQVRQMWQRHLDGQEWHYWLWCVLMFEAWKDDWLDRPGAGAGRR